MSDNISQISTCSGMSAIEHANSKFSKGYSTTGVVCTTCSHEFILPEGAGQLQKGERFASHLPESCVPAQIFSDMLMLTTLLPEARDTIPSQKRSRHTISCVNGPKTFANGCKGSLSTTPYVWTTTSLPGWFRSFILPRIARSAGPTFHSTMSPEQGEETWRVRNGRGLGSRAAGVPKIKVQDIGVMRWTINSVTGTGPSSFVSVCPYLLHPREDNSNSAVLMKVRSSRRST